MLDPFNDDEAMTDMSNPKQQFISQEPNPEMEQYVENMTQ